MNIPKQSSILTLSSKDIDKMQGPKRLEGEDFEKYKQRRKVESWITKQYMKGGVVWDSKTKGKFKRN